MFDNYWVFDLIFPSLLVQSSFLLDSMLEVLLILTRNEMSSKSTRVFLKFNSDVNNQNGAGITETSGFLFCLRFEK